jgi:hypothetical protein
MEQYKDWWSAVAFAEVGEWDTAREMIPDSKPNTEIGWLGRIFAAVAFAEEGLHDEALRIAGGDKAPVRTTRNQPYTIFDSKGYSCN